MKYHITSLPKSEVFVEVHIPFEEFEPILKRAAILLSEETEIDGFRKGKAPYEVVARKLGEMAIYEKAAHIAVEKSYMEIIRETDSDKNIFSPLGKPEIVVTKLALGNDFEYKIRTAVLPDFELSDYKSIAIKIMADKKETIVSEEDLEKSLKWIADSRSAFLPVDRPIQKGDLAEVDFEVRKEGVLIESGQSKNHPLIVGEGRFVPGFEDNLIGMRKDEEKSFDLKMPDDYHEKSLAGVVLNFKVKVIEIKEKKIPELNDEFVISLGKFSSLDELKKSVRSGLLLEKENQERERLRMTIMDEIVSKIKVDLPQVLLDAELDKMISELKQGVENMRMKWEDYLTQIKKSDADLRKEWITQAEKRVKIALCLSKIAKIEKIEPSGEEARKEADRFLSQYATAAEAKKNIDEDALRDYAWGIARNEKVFEFLESNR